jgi:hypothetical protein
VQELLNSGYRILIYSGQLDIIVANSLTQALVDSLQWNGKEEFVKVKKNHSVRLAVVSGMLSPHRVPTSHPPSSMRGKAGRYHLNEEIAHPLLPTGIGHRARIPYRYPLPLRVAKTGRNHLNEEFTLLLPARIGERF